MAEEWIYGFHAVEAAIREDRVIKVAIDPSRKDKRMQGMIALLEGLKIRPEHLTSIQLEELVRESRHQGVIAKIAVRPPESENFLYQLLDQLDHPPFLLILDEVQDPHNVGACLRSAEAFGVDAVIVPKDNACSLTPVVRKVSSGSSERVPFIEVTNLARVLEKLKARGIWISGLAGGGESTIFSADFRGPHAIVMGSEGSGMRCLTEKNCDFIVKIPMEGEIESLNVSVATGVTLAEAYRQRHQL
ncbi:23S rRNA (guanosine-2'-O-)-methyltransferase RlmB [Ignatzschineria indica]|uniref:23S rRNA (Guanosine(2251)-2'-O)-methyltransferase RlmB n=1 Tax=Ignatzschineria indica TaxID=472583 RepID=A0A2U2ANH1_9GAMM|nr:23S rRNA (guanosine(2251)-2'-O)-methyltransferase RlmB [Ignatzschineria indica]PWD84707.1 23S rRNA (guanosine(2251)-2'-O)-methyltransferase RlmB [Ignatzschineria indica]GGZ78561.1 23S rRNA (guanosine-2'-O-)-methyltransferase RlmB [Ignatzschineria indica]